MKIILSFFLIILLSIFVFSGSILLLSELGDIPVERFIEKFIQQF